MNDRFQPKKISVVKKTEGVIDFGALTNEEVARLRLLYIKNVYKQLGLEELSNDKYNKKTADIVYYDPETDHTFVFYVKDGRVRSYVSDTPDFTGMPHRIFEDFKTKYTLETLMKAALTNIVISRFHDTKQDVLNERFVSDVLLDDEERIQDVIVDEDSYRREHYPWEYRN